LEDFSLKPVWKYCVKPASNRPTSLDLPSEVQLQSAWFAHPKLYVFKTLKAQALKAFRSSKPLQ
jgi:hypothetical protein